MIIYHLIIIYLINFSMLFIQEFQVRVMKFLNFLMNHDGMVHSQSAVVHSLRLPQYGIHLEVVQLVSFLKVTVGHWDLVMLNVTEMTDMIPQNVTVTQKLP